jgi:hypothetical protein
MPALLPPSSLNLIESAVVKVIIPPTFTVAFGPNKNPAGFIKKRLAFG